MAATGTDSLIGHMHAMELLSVTWWAWCYVLYGRKSGITVHVTTNAAVFTVLFLF